jgi:hypothetical protein
MKCFPHAMHGLRFAVAISLYAVSAPSIARAEIQQDAMCPLGYDLIGQLCYNRTTGDVVFPKR